MYKCAPAQTRTFVINWFGVSLWSKLPNNVPSKARTQHSYNLSKGNLLSILLDCWTFILHKSLLMKSGSIDNCHVIIGNNSNRSTVKHVDIYLQQTSSPSTKLCLALLSLENSLFQGIYLSSLSQLLKSP